MIYVSHFTSLLFIQNLGSIKIEFINLSNESPVFNFTNYVCAFLEIIQGALPILYIILPHTFIYFAAISKIKGPFSIHQIIAKLTFVPASILKVELSQTFLLPIDPITFIIFLPLIIVHSLTTLQTFFPLALVMVLTQPPELSKTFEFVISPLTFISTTISVMLDAESVTLSLFNLTSEPLYWY
jgi:hypothetical protein